MAGGLYQGADMMHSKWLKYYCEYVGFQGGRAVWLLIYYPQFSFGGVWGIVNFALNMEQESPLAALWVVERC